MMQRFCTFLAAVVLACAQAAGAQSAPAETSAFQTFVGTWSGGGTSLETAYSKAGSAQGRTVCRLSADRYFLICEQATTVNGTLEHDVAVYSYDTERKRYRFQVVTPGFVNVTRLTIENNVWTYDDEGTVNGKTIRYRTINTFPDADTESYRTEASGDGGTTWTTTGSGTIRRVAP